MSQLCGYGHQWFAYRLDPLLRVQQHCLERSSPFPTYSKRLSGQTTRQLWMILQPSVMIDMRLFRNQRLAREMKWTTKYWLHHPLSQVQFKNTWGS
jgi:hypothetical protein